jgi:hypothetical protein
MKHASTFYGPSRGEGSVNTQNLALKLVSATDALQDRLSGPALYIQNLMKNEATHSDASFLSSWHIDNCFCNFVAQNLGKHKLQFGINRPAKSEAGCWSYFKSRKSGMGFTKFLKYVDLLNCGINLNHCELYI